MTLERVGERVMLESVREPEPALVARVGIQVREHFVHPAVLRVEHLLHLHVT